MSPLLKTLILAAALVLAACDQPESKAPPPAIADIPDSAVDPLSHMAALETDGHKGQIHFADGSDPLWFGSIANMMVYMRLPETATRPMTAYASTADAHGNSAEPWQWVNVQDAWFVLLPPDENNPLSLATWTAYPDEQSAKTVLQNIAKSRLYRFADIGDEDLLDCH
ncbi:MAG: nitrous oxide reductase accessory protein NosL [Cardiobacteriaceae bacterium]|nr:nitrous oxide reductase accessory protein NosL [Cardiobacteriaceae bacterium]